MFCGVLKHPDEDLSVKNGTCGLILLLWVSRKWIQMQIMRYIFGFVHI